MSAKPALLLAGAMRSAISPIDAVVLLVVLCSTAANASTFGNTTLPEPIAYYNLDGSGVEASGNNIDLNPIGGPTYVASMSAGLGSAINVDGFDDALVGAGFVPSSTGAISLSAWARAETRANWGSIFKNWNGQFHFGIDGGLAGTPGVLSNYINLTGIGGQPSVAATTLFPVGVWTHVAVVVDSTSQQQRLYINGSLVRTASFSGTLRSNPCPGLAIAVKPNCAGTNADIGNVPGFWHGQIDEVAAWDVALTDQQIAELYALGLDGTSILSIQSDVILEQSPRDSSEGEALRSNLDVGPGTFETLQQIADDFVLSSEAQVGAVTWEGFYFQTPLPATESTVDFRVRFYDTSLTGSPFADIAVTAIAHEAGTGDFGSPVYMFMADLASPVTVPAGRTMWISLLESDTSTSRDFRWFKAAQNIAGQYGFSSSPGTWHVQNSDPKPNFVFSLVRSSSQPQPDSQPPVANAGPDFSIHAGSTVCLNGSASFDDNTSSEALQYRWELVSTPVGSSTVLTGADSAVPCFIADLSGTYTVLLTVTDASGNAAVDTVQVSSDNLSPIANAGPDQFVVVGTGVTLDGSDSLDPDGDTIAYEWILAAPSGSNAILLDASSQAPTFTPDVPGVFEASLIVHDPYAQGTTDTVQIISASPAQYVEVQVVQTSADIMALPESSVTNSGNQTAITTFLSQAIEATQSDNVALALKKLDDAIERTDGCVLRGAPDGNGPGRDWITDCAEQQQIYSHLQTARQALLQ